MAIDRQMRESPQMLFSDTIRFALASNGLARLSEYNQARDPDLAADYDERRRDLSRQRDAIDRASEICRQRAALGRLHDLLGEEKFLTFLTNVLYGNEVDFLLACASKVTLEACLPLTQEAWPFN
jgi:hypothetical protein